ncbi:MAG TPA: amidohydrolase family protein, partial [Gaiellaceae bacterium]|nr:amidohydrolase family protein [Gaiellaceae bacterium]
LRVWQSVPHETIPALEALKLRSGLGSLLRVGYLKVFMDGTLGSQTAWMLDGSGVQITSGEELAEIVRRGAEAGWPVGVHAIGDRANREALDAFEQTRDVWAPRGVRPRIEHAQCVAAADLPRFAQFGVAASVQFTHAPSDEHLARRFWPDKLDQTYSFRSLLDSGAVLANGSDAPIEELEPWAGVVAAVLDHWREDEKLTIEQALHAICVAPAWLSHDERVRGTLLPGRAADLVVLDRDPFADGTDLRAVEVVATMVAGRWVYNPPPW